MTAESKLSIREVLVATDFSAQSNPAVEAAFALAGHFRARLHVLHVTPDPSKKVVAQSLLDVLTADGAGVETIRVVAVGNAATEIVKYACRKRIDLIVVGTHGRGGLSHAVMGSVAEAVVRMAPCQVLTCGPRAHALAETSGLTV